MNNDTSNNTENTEPIDNDENYIRRSGKTKAFYKSCHKLIWKKVKLNFYLFYFLH